MKLLLKFIGICCIITLSVICAYYGYDVYKARAYTHEFILPDLEKSQWRVPTGRVRKFEMLCRELSPPQKKILIKVQDPGFYNHKGIDLKTPGCGLTTITQAVVKKLYFTDFKPGIAKLRQSLIARFVVNDLISKDDQLTLFVNAMYFGVAHEKPIVGLKSAAFAYYFQPVDRLTEDQYISLIAMLVMPGTFHIIDHPEWNLDRTRRIKALMAGRYKPKGLMDQFYGDLPKEVINAGLPPASYFGDPLKEK